MIGKIINLMAIFKIPLIVLGGIIAYLILEYGLHLTLPAILIVLAVIILGSYPLFVETFQSILRKHFALDYIAILAILTALGTQQYLVAAVIVLMLSSGTTLEEYGMIQARKSLTALTDRIPHEVSLWHGGQVTGKLSIEQVRIGQEILVRKGEVIPLDGELVSETGLTDESSLTGEPYLMEKNQGDQLRSGTVNIGNPLVLRVTKPDAESTYRKIIDMVQAAAAEKSPLVRLADRYSLIFTAITFIIATFAFFLSYDVGRILAVLVIATPCPLILATPIALMGGVNAAAKRKIIMKHLGAVEVLSRVHALIFDKTGTITLGKPQLQTVQVIDAAYSEEKILAIAAAIERHSLHPLAKALVEHAKEKKVSHLVARGIEEKIGYGITGEVDKISYTLSKVQDDQGMTIALRIDEQELARFVFEDQLKQDAKQIIQELTRMGLHLHIFTGDKKDRAEKVLQQLEIDITVKTDCSPEEKKNGIEALKKEGYVTAMIGDGINDAPALALADVGMVFSNEEQTASSEAADVVFLGGDLSMVLQSLRISRNTIRIALQSIIFGIGLSIVGMLFAAFGFIVPLVGAILQEAIDVIVILNALRASR